MLEQKIVAQPDLSDYDYAHVLRIHLIAAQYKERKAKFSLYQRLFKMSADEKMAYKLYKQNIKYEKNKSKSKGM